jgi:hypothetical protein
MSMTSAKLIVAYPQPKDVQAFKAVYEKEHVPWQSPNWRAKSFHGSALTMCGVSRRKGNVGPCSEDFVGRSARDHDRGREFVHVLIASRTSRDWQSEAAYENDSSDRDEGIGMWSVAMDVSARVALRAEH